MPNSLKFSADVWLTSLDAASSCKVVSTMCIPFRIEYSPEDVRQAIEEAEVYF
jgi:hypothetical protein